MMTRAARDSRPFAGLPHSLATVIRLALILLVATLTAARPAAAAEEPPTPPAAAAEEPPTPEQAVASSQAAIGRVLGDRVFRDDHGRDVSLSQFRGRPLVITMIYTACSTACPVILQTVAGVAADAWQTLGPDSFAVVTIGFDSARDTPERMRLFARQQGLSSKNWFFLSGDPATIRALADDIGFSFYVSPKGFDHLSQTTVVDADGRVYRQVYGETFDPPLLFQPLRELAYGLRSPFASLDDVLTKVRLFCTVYDPILGRYRFSYALFFELFVSASVVIGLAVIVARQWWRLTGRRRRRRRRQA